MKKNYLRFGGMLLSLALLAGAVTACGDQKKEEKGKQPAKTEAKTPELPNYRYVDVDTVLAKYNLAKDYNEEMMRMQSNAESQMSQKEKQMQNFASSVQNKMQNNGYLTQESYKQDEQKMANLQNEYQRSANTLQNNIMTAAANAQKAVNDSITAFIENYNKLHGYDAIFLKGATLYINPALDITDEVVEGLNARYNKVKK